MTINTVTQFISALSDNVKTRFYINGEWVLPGADRGTLSVISPDTEELLIELPEAGKSDINSAVAAARQSFDSGVWSSKPVAERVKYVSRLNDELKKRLPVLSRAWTAQIGTPTMLADIMIQDGTNCFDYYLDMAPEFSWEESRPVFPGPGKAKIVQEPVGVCALIAPWNHPFGMIAFKTAPALIAGCSIVLKPSPETPLEALIFAEAADAAGIPAGVVNVIPCGREGGEQLIQNPEIDKVSFTGSTAVGKHIASVCSSRMARSSMELGGKSAAIILDDANLDTVLQTLGQFTMTNAGQGCLLLTRILVPKSRAEEIIGAYIGMVSTFKVGDPWAPDTFMGPVAMKRQMERVLNYIEIGKSEGATIAMGGARSEVSSKGYFIEPTVFTNVKADMRIAQEEIFGPVICFLEYEDEDEAVRIANNSDYGLNGAVFSADENRAIAVARRIRTGTVGINTANVQQSIPFGGFKQSGIGREMGREALQGFLETKSLFFAA